MGSLEPTHLIALAITLASIAAMCGLIASPVARRNKRRARTFFLVGFLCGLTAGAIPRARRRGLRALRALASCAAVRPLRASKTQGLTRRRSHFTSQIRDRRTASRMDCVRKKKHVGI
jgi:hypothetical protein